MAQTAKVSDPGLKRRMEAIRFAEGSIAHLAPGVSLADELIADRRAETRAEETRDKVKRQRGAG